MTTRNHIIAFVFLALIGNFSTLNAQMLVKKDKAKKKQNSSAIQKDNQGLGQKLPTKENVTALLTDFEWDAKTTTNREEAFRILDALGGEFLHVVPVGNRSFNACSELPSGNFVCIGVNQKDPNRGRYSLRYGSMEDYSNIFLNKSGQTILSKKFLELNSYVFQKQTDLSHEASFLGLREKDYKIDNRPSMVFFPGSTALKYLAENPAVFMTNRGRARTLYSLISNFYNHSDEEWAAPLIINDYSQDDSIREGDVIFGVVDNGKIDRVNLNNYEKKLHKGKSLLKVILFRKGRFLVRNWDPTFLTYDYSTTTDYKSIQWSLREQLIYYVLNSGLQESNISSISDYPFLPVLITRGYSKRTLKMLISYGANIHLRYDHDMTYWKEVDDKMFNGYSLLHIAAKAHRHRRCTYYFHHVYKDGTQENKEIYENAYFDLIALGLKDDQSLEKPHKTLGYSTPKEFYDLANNPDHIYRPKEKTQIDWGAVANAVVAGVGAAVQEKQRQIQETQQINRINQAYQARIDAGIEAQRQQVAKNNAEYLARMQGGQPQTATSVQNTITSSNNSSGSQTNQNDIPGYTNQQNIELNAGRNPASDLSRINNLMSTNTSSFQLSSTNNADSPITNEEQITYYSLGVSYASNSSSLPAIGSNRGNSRLVGYRNSYQPRKRSNQPCDEDNSWYVETYKVPIWETTLKTIDIESVKNQINNERLMFWSINEAMYSNIAKTPGDNRIWSRGEAQQQIDIRDCKRATQQ